MMKDALETSMGQNGNVLLVTMVGQSIGSESLAPRLDPAKCRAPIFQGGLPLNQKQGNQPKLGNLEQPPWEICLVATSTVLKNMCYFPLALFRESVTGLLFLFFQGTKKQVVGRQQVCLEDLFGEQNIPSCLWLAHSGSKFNQFGRWVWLPFS